LVTPFFSVWLGQERQTYREGMVLNLQRERERDALSLIATTVTATAHVRNSMNSIYDVILGPAM